MKHIGAWGGRRTVLRETGRSTERETGCADGFGEGR